MRRIYDEDNPAPPAAGGGSPPRGPGDAVLRTVRRQAVRWLPPAVAGFLGGLLGGLLA